MDSENRGKLYDFMKLMKDNVVEIPIIQRDYAQGREDKQEIRREFLNAIRNSLLENRTINLDFIYGSTTDKILQPLDGQQRLTTLFLLHWYAAVKDQELNEDTKTILSKFTYETRASSREFCQALIYQSVKEICRDTIISALIRDCNWYFLSWNNDPTIDSMLRTIDDIHLIFYDIADLWKALVSDEKLISFYYIELKNFGLSDDLYIKMNARGKALTPFENFKATFQKRIIDNKWDDNKGFEETFSCKIDTKWTDLFWKYKKNNMVDDAIIRFFATVVMINLSLEKPPMRFESIKLLQNDPHLIRPNYLSLSGYDYLYKVLDIYAELYESNQKLEIDFPYGSYIVDGDIFRTLVYSTSNASYTQKVIFFAQTEYLLRNDTINLELFKDWMRVVRNIVNRGDIERSGSKASIVRSPESFDGAINLINELADGCGNIYEFLAKDKNVNSQFAKSQVEEERIKARLVYSEKNYKQAIFNAEDIEFFNGRISLLFECIGFDGNLKNFKIDDFIDITNVAEKYINNEITDDFRRALLTISTDNGDYNYYDYWWSWSYAVDANKRCLITKKSELEYFVYGNYKGRNEYKQYVVRLLKKLVTYDLNQIIEMFIPPSEMPNWKKRLIKEPELLHEYCESKYIAIPESEECCYLLKGVRPRDLESCYKVQ